MANTTPTVLHHFIDGELTQGQSNRTSDVYNPATGQVESLVPLASVAEVDAAIQSAKAAYPAWNATPPAKRARILFKFRDLVESHLDELATLLSRQHGKTLEDAKGSV